MSRGKRRLRMLENRVLRGIFGPKRVELMVDSRKLYSEQLHNFYDEIGGQAACAEEKLLGKETDDCETQCN
jgi:hypothetical protein